MNIPNKADLDLLTNSDLEDILNVIQTANNRASLIEMRRNVVKSLRRAFRAESVTFFLADREFKSIDNRNVISVGTDLRYIDAYAGHYSMLDPFQREAHAGTPVCKVDDIIPFRQWVSSKIYNELYTKLNIHYKLSIHLRISSKLLGTIGICRPKTQNDFSSQDMAKARVIAPHLVTALENTFQFTAAEEAKEILNGLGCQPPPFGVIVLNEKLEALYLSTGALQFCNALAGNGDGAQIPSVKNTEIDIPHAIIQDCLVLKQSYERGENSENLRHLRILDLGENRVFQIFSMITASEYCDKSSFKIIVYIQNFSDISRNKENLFKERYCLTNREVEIARCVSKGMTNEEIGDLLCISRFTVETHLKNIFYKTAVKHRAGLTGLLRNT